MRTITKKHHDDTKTAGMSSVDVDRRRKTPERIVFLLDVDNTLLDNDRVEADLDQQLVLEFGSECRDRYWALFEALRAEHQYADYLGALQRFRSADLCDPGLLRTSSFLLDYPFAERLYPGTLEVIRHLQRWGQTVILSDGDAVFQPHKIQRSGLGDAVKQQVLICIHKEQMLDAVIRRYPAEHYFMVDDKLHILKAMKDTLGNWLTTVFTRQGHYALDPETSAGLPRADVTLDNFGDLLHYDIPVLSGDVVTGK